MLHTNPPSEFIMMFDLWPAGVVSGFGSILRYTVWAGSIAARNDVVPGCVGLALHKVNNTTVQNMADVSDAIEGMLCVEMIFRWSELITEPLANGMP